VTSTGVRFMTMLAIAATTLSAQSPPLTATLPAAKQVCDMRLALLTVRVADGRGAAAVGAMVTVTRVRGGSVVRRDSVGVGGDITILQDGDIDITRLSPSGEPFDVVVSQGRRSRRVRVVVGSDSARCHIRLLSGPTVIRL
jgi:hypothetical protein